MSDNSQLRELPGTDEVLHEPSVVQLIQNYGRALAVYAVRQAIDQQRKLIKDGKDSPDLEYITNRAAAIAAEIGAPSLRPVINATGIVLHTNLGRAPLGLTQIAEIAAIAGGYSNLEFDLDNARRGSRNTHLRKLLSFLTGAEDALVVNNNAAGIMLALGALARDRQVIISRSELIEIGDSFRLPEIMAASGAQMVEVGTTNRTILSDYQSVLTPETAMILKAHKSNYTIRGFAAEVPVKELSKLARAHRLIMMYDIGSGLLRKPKSLALHDEPDVAGAITDQADLVAFSADKLLGGPQAGLLVGKQDLITKISRAPLMRALRVGKLTIAALSAACRGYLKDQDLPVVNPIFAMLERNRQDLEILAASLLDELKSPGIEARIIESIGRCGGGTLPDLEIPSLAIEIMPRDDFKDNDHTFAECLHQRLLQMDPPVLAVLREGKILFDVLTLLPDQIPVVVHAISKAIVGVPQP